MTQVTADEILRVLNESVKNRTPITRDKWIDAAWALNTLLLDENDKLFAMEQAVAIKKRDILSLQEKKNVSEAEAQIKCLDDYRLMRSQEAKVSQILEFIRAKLF